MNYLKDGIEIEEYWYDIFSYFYQNEKWKYKLENSLKGIYFTNKTSNISEEAINKLYGNVLRTSISRLEQYRACPFSYYLKYRIKIIRKKHIKNKFNRYRFFYA